MRSEVPYGCFLWLGLVGLIGAGSWWTFGGTIAIWAITGTLSLLVLVFITGYARKIFLVKNLNALQTQVWNILREQARGPEWRPLGRDEDQLLVRMCENLGGDQCARVLNSEIDLGHISQSTQKIVTHCSTEIPCPETVKKLIKDGAYIDVADADGQTPLILLSQRKHEHTSIDDPDFSLLSDFRMLSRLEQHSSSVIECISILIEAGANCSHRDKANNTAFDYAVNNEQWGKNEIINKLRIGT